MKVVVSKKQLQKVISTFPESKTLPLINVIELKAINGVLVLNATDIETYISYELQAQVEIEGSIYVDKRDLMKILKVLTEKQITLISEDNSLKIITDTSTYKIKIQEDSYLNEFKLPNNLSILAKISGEELSNGIRKTSYAVSKNNEHSSYSIKHICFNFIDDYLDIVSANNHRLALYQIKLDRENINGMYLITLPAIKTLEKLIDKKEVIELFSQDDWLVFKGSNWILYVRYVKEKYPDYYLLFPKNFNLEIKIDKNKLLQAFKKLSKFIDKDVGVIFYAKDGELRVETPYDYKKETCFNELISTGYEGIEFDVYIKPKYVIEAVEHIDDKQFVMSFIDKESVIQFTPVDNREPYLALVMPMLR